MKIHKTIPGRKLVLGHRGENQALAIVFDITEWVEAYGYGTAHLLHQRRDDAEPYPVATIQEDTQLSWTVTDADTAIPGHGMYELHYYVGEALVKTSTGETYTRPALAYGAEPPEAAKGWVDQVLKAADSVLEPANNAAASAQEAAESAGHASVSEQNAFTAQKAASDAAARAALFNQEAAASADEAKQAAESVGKVKTVNGMEPDENGNVQIDVITDEEFAELLAALEVEE